MKLSSPKHPVWNLATLLVVGVMFALLANTPDWDELRNFMMVAAYGLFNEWRGRRGATVTDQGD
jgi:hypothetical protein